LIASDRAPWRRRRSLVGGLGLVGLVVTSVALPCPGRAETPQASAKQAPEDAKQSAQRHLDRGNELFRRDELGAALAEFQAAFDLYPSPKLRFNLGQCERALGHAEAAAMQFERFLAEATDVSPELRAEAQRYLDQARAAAAPPPPQKPAPSPLPSAPAPRVEAPVAIAPASPPAAKPVYTRWWFWGAVGVVVVGGAVAAFALSRPNDPVCDSQNCF
jgi:tetratricopeptide (TPR) repeat protein